MSTARPFTMPVLRELFTNNELLYREQHRPKKDERPEGVRSVCILGGGTAGWFTAIALAVHLPWVEVTVVETPTIPVIGVGEATVPSLVAFVHHYLRLGVTGFNEAVRPTWKQGIRFEWGQPGDYVFQAPFDWEVNGVGMLGAMGEKDNVSTFTLQGHLMERGTVPIVRTGKKVESFLPILAFAYHLDNARLVDYLRQAAASIGVKHVSSKVTEAVVKKVDHDDEPHVAQLVTEEGDELAADFFIDCSGFRSFLLEKTLETGFQSYEGSLFVDRAFAFNSPHGGKPKPYTTARTMESGWCWTIPMHQDDHRGYVYSSAHCSDDEAAAEVKKSWPNITNERLVKFRSGRHDRCWVGNVFAIGNAYAFVEPLESTGLLMIQRSITTLVRAFPLGPGSEVMRRLVNTTVGRDWDRLRWFLAAHYKFNAKLDSPFWKDAREKVDIEGLQTAIDVFKACGPLSLLPRSMRRSIDDEADVFFYGVHALDNILLGQKVPHAPIAREPSGTWRKRHKLATDFAKRSMDYPLAIATLMKHPEWLEELVTHPNGWVGKMAQFL